MSRPLFPESNLTKIARERGGREQLERRPAPAASEAAAGSAMWPMSYDLLPWDAAKRGIDGDYSFNPTRDSAYLGGFYVEASADADNAIMYFRLGPRGSAWGLNFECDRGSDCGIVHTSWQVVSEDSGALGNGAGFEGGLGLIYDTYAGASTFYAADSASFDLYNATPSLHQNFDGYSQFRIMGAEGDVITQDAQTNADDPFYKHFDGGPGIWACKIRINGKNASSSGYRVRIENAFVRRWTVGGNPTG